MVIVSTSIGPARAWWDVSRGCGGSVLPSGTRRAAGVAVVTAVLVACGSERPAGSSSAAPEEDVVVTTAPGESPAAEASHSSPDGASFGVDSTSWPGSMEGARTLLAALPAEMDGQAREYMPALSESEAGEGDQAAGELAALSYGQELSVLVSDDTISGEPGSPPQVVGAQGKLAAMFGVMYACDPDTYEGTIEPSPGFPVPGYAQVDDSTPPWFSCRIDGAEGAEDFSAQAVGWTSSQTAWLVVGPDDGAVRRLITALDEAKG